MRKLIVLIITVSGIVYIMTRKKTDTVVDNTVVTVQSTLYEKEVYSIRDSIIVQARQYLGSPYQYGGKSPSGFDCSGFVYFVFRSFNVKVPRSSKDYMSLTKKDLDNVTVGDVIVFTGYKERTEMPGHVGIVSQIKSGKIYFIHSSTDKGVVEASLDTPYYKQRFLFYVDVLTNSIK